MNDNKERNLNGSPKQIAWANDLLNKWEEKWFGTIFEEPYKKFISKYMEINHAGNIIELQRKPFFKQMVEKYLNVSSVMLAVPNELVKSISSYRANDSLRRVVLELPADIRYVQHDLGYCERTAKKGECVYFETYEDAISEKNGFTKFSIKFNLKYDDIRMGCRGNVRVDKFYFCDEDGNATSYLRNDVGRLLSIKTILKAIKESL